MKVKKTKKARYKKAQRKNFRKGFDVTWVTTAVGDKLAKAIALGCGTHPKFGVCHGVRNGTEVKVLQRHFPEAEIIGTDLDPKVSEIGNCICLDFHCALVDWMNKFDFVYSNALGHSNDPHRALKVWFSTLRLGGVCVIQWAKGREREPSDTHCVSATYKEMGALLLEFGQPIDSFDVKAGKMEFHVFVAKKIHE